MKVYTPDFVPFIVEFTQEEAQMIRLALGATNLVAGSPKDELYKTFFDAYFAHFGEDAA